MFDSRLDPRQILVRAALGGLGAVLLLLAATHWFMPAWVSGPVEEGGWMRRSRAPFRVTGFADPALDPETLRSPSAVSRFARLRFAELPTSQGHRVALVVRSGGASVPRLTVAVDGAEAWSGSIGPLATRIEVVLPPGRSAPLVTLDVAPTAGASGSTVLVDEVALAPEGGHFRPNAGVVARWFAAAAAIVAGIWLCGATGAVAVGLSGVSLGALVWLLVRDAAFLGSYTEALLPLGLSMLAVGGAVALVRARWPGAGPYHWGTAVAVVAALTLVEIALVWHPLAIVGDGIFQVHRAQAVRQGAYFFTSVTPRPFFEFPYAIALYVTALPFWPSVRGDLEVLHLLRVLCLLASAGTGLALYAAVRRGTGAPGVALLAAALWPLARAPVEALSNANLTNLFGQAIFGAGLLIVAALPSTGLAGLVALPALLALIAVGFLSHFGTLTVGLAVLGAVAATVVLLGTPAARRTGAGIVVVTLLATAVSWQVYYGHFIPTYRATYERLAHEAPDDSSKMVAGPSVKLRRWWQGGGDDYGRPGVAVLALAAVGLGLVASRRSRDACSLVLAGWVLAWVALSALGIATALTLRANLAVAPALMALAALALGALAARGRRSALLTAGLAGVVAWDGLRVLVACVSPGW